MERREGERGRSERLKRGEKRQSSGIVGLEDAATVTQLPNSQTSVDLYLLVKDKLE